MMEGMMKSVVYLEQESYMNVQYLVDQKGHKTGVFLSVEEFDHLIELLEEAQDIKDFKVSKADNDDWVSLIEAKKQLGL